MGGGYSKHIAPITVSNDETSWQALKEKHGNKIQTYKRKISFNFDVSVVISSSCTIDKASCLHSYLEILDGIHICRDCGEKLTCPEYAARLAEEEELERSTPVDFIPPELLSNEEERKNYVGKQSQLRGVTIGFLWKFTEMYDVWDWSARALIRQIVVPMTQHNRCRFVELPEMANHVGPASTFISYAQAGTWGIIAYTYLHLKSHSNTHIHM